MSERAAEGLAGTGGRREGGGGGGEMWECGGWGVEVSKDLSRKQKKKKKKRSRKSCRLVKAETCRAWHAETD